MSADIVVKDPNSVLDLLSFKLSYIFCIFMKISGAEDSQWSFVRGQS